MKKRLKINISNLKVKGKYREYAYAARLAKEWDTLKNAAGRQQIPPERERGQSSGFLHLSEL